VVEVLSQAVSLLLSDGRAMSVKAARDPPTYEQRLLALNHDSVDEMSNFL